MASELELHPTGPIDNIFSAVSYSEIHVPWYFSTEVSPFEAAQFPFFFSVSSDEDSSVSTRFVIVTYFSSPFLQIFCNSFLYD
jgi:hypothetical protein